MTQKQLLFKLGVALVSGVMFNLPIQAQGLPEISPSLKKMLAGLPIAGIKDEVMGMVGALKNTNCGGKLTGCYTTQSGPLQLYFFTSGQAQQTFLLVIDKTLPMPGLLKENVQKVMGDTALSSPIISISTTDFDLDTVAMPPGLQKVVRERYFNVNTLSFSSGVQLAARANLGGAIKQTMEAFGVKGDQLTMRAAVVMPIPTDLASGAGAGAGMANALQHGETLKKAGADATKLEAYVEFQFAPDAKLTVGMPRMDLTDATFFLNNALTFGYKGNATYEGVSNKKILVQFQTPLNPAGALDLLDFQFRMATPPSFTLEDAAHVVAAMASPDPRLARYGGGFIRNIASYKSALLGAAQPLSVFQLRNPQAVPEYRFGDRSKPFPNDPKYFNMAVLGPLTTGGPLMRFAGEATILGQIMGSLEASAGTSGLHGKVIRDLKLKLGPLGRVTVEKMAAEVDIDNSTQRIRLKGNYGGQVVEVTMAGTKLAINVPSNCVNPFEIKAEVALEPSTNIADVFEAQGGANVDPKGIGCVGPALEAAYKKIAGEYKSLGGYTAKAANAELKKATDAANAAARQAYETTKNTARNVANSSTNAANRALKEADNAFKGFGKKKKHKTGPDPKFAASVFDWDFYYDNAPDKVNRKNDLATYWRDSGFNEGQRGSLEFDVKYYRARYFDVQELCAPTNYSCVLQHWLDKGLELGRQGSANFSVASYLKRSPELQNTLGRENYADAMEHWLDGGMEAGGDGRPEYPSDGTVSGPIRIGGGGGESWSDLGTCAGQYVNGFRVRAGGLVDTVQFSYANKGWANLWGYNGNSKFTADVTLASGEYIVRVDYRSGGRIDQLSFTTNHGRTYGPYGGGGGSSGTYNVTPGEKLGCMAGRAGSSIDQLTFSSTGPR